VLASSAIGSSTRTDVPEAQELTDAEWQVLLLRCPSRSFTIVGDRAQARHGFMESWQERLERIGLASVRS
jgi:superfamily I DNA/RNA helicase